MIEHVTQAIIEKLPTARITWWREGTTWFFKVKATEDDIDFEFGTLPHSLESTFFVKPEDEYLRRAQAEEMAQLILCDYLAAKRARTEARRKRVYGDRGEAILSFYAIYDHPEDYPNDWIIRRWNVVARNPLPQPETKAIVCEDAEAARQRIQELKPGAILITIDDPDPHIYEVWS